MEITAGRVAETCCTPDSTGLEPDMAPSPMCTELRPLARGTSSNSASIVVIHAAGPIGGDVAGDHQVKFHAADRCGEGLGGQSKIRTPECLFGDVGGAARAHRETLADRCRGALRSEGEDCDLRALVRVCVRQCQLQGPLTDLINDCLAGFAVGEACFKVFSFRSP